jgi:hypothetical protein
MNETDYLKKYERLSDAANELAVRYSKLPAPDRAKLGDLPASCSDTLTEAIRGHLAIDAHMASKAAPAKPAAPTAPEKMEFANCLEKAAYRVDESIKKMSRAAFDALPMEAKNDYMSRGGKLV